MKKILFISNVCKAIDNFSYSSMIAAKELGYDFHIAVNCSDISAKEIKDYEKKYGVTFHQIDFIRNPFHPANYKAYKQLMLLMKNERFDMVHCNTPVGGMIGRICSNKAKIQKIIYMAHGFHFYKGASLINKTLFKWAEMIMAHYTDAIITINNEDYEAAKKFKLRSGKNVYYMPGVGVDTKLNKIKNDDKQSLKQSLGLKNDDIILIAMGDLIRRKNYVTSIKAIAKASNSKLQFLICGKGMQLEALKKLTKELKVDNQIHFLGYRTDITELLNISDIFLFTTYQEGLPRSMMEAMAAGLPCITSKIRGNVDLIENGKGGYLCEPDDYDGFAKAISDVVMHEEIRKKMGESNLHTIKKYDVENVNAIMKEIYNEVFSSIK